MHDCNDSIQFEYIVGTWNLDFGKTLDLGLLFIKFYKENIYCCARTGCLWMAEQITLLQRLHLVANALSGLTCTEQGLPGLEPTPTRLRINNVNHALD